jgi:hypothetical protein
MAKTKNVLVKTENEGKHLSSGFVIPYEVVDGIVKAALIEARNHHVDEIKKHINNPEKNWMHPEDIMHGREFIYCMTHLIDNYYGGE